MAIDTRDKRAACLGIVGSYRSVLPRPSGTIGEPQRRQLAGFYPGLLALSPVSNLWMEPARPTLWSEPNRSIVWTEINRTLKWSAPVMAILVKRAAEMRLYTMDLSALPEFASDTVTGVNSVVAGTTTPGASPSDLTISAKAVASGSKGATCKIAGGLDGATYLIEFTVTTANGYTICGVGYLFVDDR
jgi:hypothetical protein